MEWLKRLGAAIDYIEENLDKGHSEVWIAIKKAKEI